MWLTSKLRVLRSSILGRLVLMGPLLIGPGAMAPHTVVAATSYTDTVIADKPISYWRLADNTGTGIKDERGKNSNGVIVGSVNQHQEAAVDGGSSIRITADQGHIEIPNSPSLAIKGPVTVDAWVNLASGQENQQIIQKYDVEHYKGYGLRIAQGRVFGFVMDADDWTYTAGPANNITLRQWHHVAMTADGNQIKVYLDGTLNGSTASKRLPTPGSVSLKIGANGDRGISQFDGSIAEVAIYDHALSADQVQAHYAAGVMLHPSSGATSCPNGVKPQPGFSAQPDEGLTARICLPTNAVPSAPPAPTSGDHCGQPQLTSSGVPQVVVVLVDGVRSVADESGSLYPLVVGQPEGLPTVMNYCPVDANGGEHTWPPGLNLSLRKWSGFWVPRYDPSSGDPGGTSQICTGATTFHPTDLNRDHGPLGSGSTLAAQPIGPLMDGRKDNCLVAQLADAGAVILPYSYAGATLNDTPSGAVFTFTGYTAIDTESSLVASVWNLDVELSSIHNVWPTSRIVVVGHSMGGQIAQLWWECKSGQCADGLFTGSVNHDIVGQIDMQSPTPMQETLQTAGDRRGVNHVFSLDSPINGIAHCAGVGLPGLGYSTSAISDTWCWLWDHRMERMPAITSMDADGSYTAIGTLGDPTYGLNVAAKQGGGGLQAQLIHDVGCLRSLELPSQLFFYPPGTISLNDTSALDQAITNDDKLFQARGCLQSPPSVLSPPECDGDKDLYGATGHHIVKACTGNITLILGSVASARDARTIVTTSETTITTTTTGTIDPPTP